MNKKPLPDLLAGPILRRVTREQVAIWMALSRPIEIQIELSYSEKGGVIHQVFNSIAHKTSFRIIKAADALYYGLVDLKVEPLPTETEINYQVLTQDNHGWATVLPSDLHYPSRSLPSFKVPQKVRQVLHGSCRNPHTDTEDGLVFADCKIDQALQQGESVPDLLVFSGDQIYADDVSGPMLNAIHQVIARLGFPPESIEAFRDESLKSSSDLYDRPALYRRDRLLPTQDQDSLFFSGKKKPIFTTVNGKNHLITLAEFMTMYLMVWYTTLWTHVELSPPKSLDQEERIKYQSELKRVEHFIEGLSSARRLMAHIPVAMIFDDPDISDDWNLHRAWEESAYGHPLSHRIISNGLIAYLIHQGWGNNPPLFHSLFDGLKKSLIAPGGDDHTQLSEHLIRGMHWGFQWETEPPLVVLDTRTQRWRSERSAERPSGLMDWESLTDLQDQIKGKASVILVSPAPVFGVKLIEVIQKVITLLGKPLMVDAENWMAHPGSANGILNIFRHRQTPKIFTILSGDVHYSFVYDIRWRNKEGPEICQICSSGIRNTFPDQLLVILDKLNRVLYSPRSPLNWLTRRRRLRVSPRKLQGMAHGRRLLNQSGIGLVDFDDNGRPVRVSQVTGLHVSTEFLPRLEESVWH